MNVIRVNGDEMAYHTNDSVSIRWLGKCEAGDVVSTDAVDPKQELLLSMLRNLGLCPMGAPIFTIAIPGTYQVTSTSGFSNVQRLS